MYYVPPEESIVISIRMEKSKDEKLKQIAKQLGINKNRLINKALDHYVEMLIKFNQVSKQK